MPLHAVALVLAALVLVLAPQRGQAETIAIRGTSTFQDDLSVPLPGDRQTTDFNPIPTADTGTAEAANPSTVADLEATGNIGAARGRTSAISSVSGTQGQSDRGPVTPTARGPMDADGQPASVQGPALEAEAPRDNFGDDADAYEPLGIRVGTFLLFPSLEVTGGWTDNVEGARGGKAGGLYRIKPEAILRSDWTRHQWETTLRGSYTGYPGSDQADDPNFSTTTTVRIDARDSTTVDLEAGYTLDRESESSADVAPGTKTTSLVHQLRGAAAVTQEFGRLAVTGKGSIDRTIYTGGSRIGGGSLDSKARDNSLYTTSLRTTYEVTSAFKPFVEGTLLERVYDTERDASGYRRGSSGYELKTGATIDLGAKIHAEGALGWHHEELRDSRFDPLEGLIAEASVVWSPSRLTTVTLSGETTFEPTTMSSSAGSTEYSGSFKIAHSLRRNLEVDGGLGLAFRTYQGLNENDFTTTGTLGLAWSLNRNVALTARYDYEDLRSDRRGASYTSNSIEVGVKVRR